MIKFKTLPRILGRERCKVEGVDDNLSLKHSFMSFLLYF